MIFQQIYGMIRDQAGAWMIGYFIVSALVFGFALWPAMVMSARKNKEV